MLKSNTSPKSPWIELSNDTFAERKYCQVSAYESETFHRRRSYGISYCENGKQKPPKRPLPLDYVDPHLIQQCLGLPQAPPETAAPTVEALSHTYAVKSPLVTMVQSKFAPKGTPSGGPIAKPQYLPHPCIRPTYGAERLPDAICRFSTMHWTDGHTDRHTDRPTERSRESLMTIGRCAPRATRPNNNKPQFITRRNVSMKGAVQHTLLEFSWCAILLLLLLLRPFVKCRIT